jgi:hypothetical protein
MRFPVKTPCCKVCVYYRLKRIANMIAGMIKGWGRRDNARTQNRAIDAGTREDQV